MGDSADAKCEPLKDAPIDKVFGIVNQYKCDPRADKINLAIGQYTDACGRTICFDAVSHAVQKLSQHFKTGYLPPAGDEEFCLLSQKLIFSSQEQIPTIASVQAPSGTGSLTLAGHFARLILPDAHKTKVYVSNPTWPVHNTLFAMECGYEVKQYTYWSAKSMGVDFEAMMADLTAAPRRSIIVAHACAHNPTGQDLSHDQWESLFDLCIANSHLLIIDCAYQGFASGDFARDGWAIQRAREMLSESDAQCKFIVCQSYAKNMSLYGHRTGCCHVVCDNEVSAAMAHGNLGHIARNIWSNPPRMGSDICKMVLTDASLRDEWMKQLTKVSSEILELRAAFRSELESRIPGSCWKHLTDQIGMFAYTGLSAEQCQRLRSEFGIYLLDSGRVSLAGGLQPHQVRRTAEAISQVYSVKPEA